MSDYYIAIQRDTGDEHIVKKGGSHEPLCGFRFDYSQTMLGGMDGENIYKCACTECVDKLYVIEHERLLEFMKTQSTDSFMNALDKIATDLINKGDKENE